MNELLESIPTSNGQIKIESLIDKIARREEVMPDGWMW